MSSGFRTCPVCQRLTLNTKCDHPLCPTNNEGGECEGIAAVIHAFVPPWTHDECQDLAQRIVESDELLSLLSEADMSAWSRGYEYALKYSPDPGQPAGKNEGLDDAGPVRKGSSPRHQGACAPPARLTPLPNPVVPDIGGHSG